MPRHDGQPTARERLLSPRQFITRDDAEEALEYAHDLVRLGGAVFRAAPALLNTGEWAANWGTGGSGYWFPEDWEQTAPGDGTALSRWRYGDALGFVTGHAFDVLDVDPRNGGDLDLAEVERLELMPTVYARAATPSGGEHLFIAVTGTRKTKRGGLDLQAGVDGEGHGFVFIAPTVRKSKVDGQIRPYVWRMP